MTEKRTRPKQIKFWTTEEEYSAIKDKVYESRLTQNEFLIRSALEKDIIVVEGLKDVLLELSKEGNEINEMRSRKSIKEEEFLQLKARLMKLWDTIEEILEKTNN